MRNSQGGDAEFLHSRLRRFRRRAFVAGFLDAASSCLALSFALWIASAFFFASAARLPAFALGGLLAALVSAAMRLPSLAGVARNIDRRAGLEQRLETAAELMERPSEGDVVTALILKDARRVTETLRSDVMPLRLAAGRATWAAFAMLTIVLLAAAFFGRNEGSGSLRFSPSGSIGEQVPESAVSIPDSQGPGSSGAEAAVSREEDAEDEGESVTAESSSEPARSPSLSSAEPEESARRPYSLDALETPATSSGEEEWTAIEAPLGRAIEASDASSVAETGGTGAPAERGTKGFEAAGGGISGESRAASFPEDVPPGTHYESPSSQGGVPPGLREYVRAYFSKLRKAR
jgi:hypothetical protein